MIRFYFLLVLLCSVFQGHAQYTLQGRVTAVAAAVPVVNAHVQILNTPLGTITDSVGRFNLKVYKPGIYHIQISTVGFATVTKAVTVGDTMETLDIELPESFTQLDAIVVTAQKVEEAIMQVPVSTTVVSSEAVRQFRLWSASQISGIVPNLYSSNPGDQRNVTAIRGITTTSYDPAVTTYIDGVNQFGLDTYFAQLLDIERIEILRGPQGTLYGRNAMGGVINIITKQPSEISSGFAELNIGEAGQQRYSLGVRGPLFSNTIQTGMAVVHERSDGFYSNLFTQSSFDKKSGTMVSSFVRYLISPQLDLNFQFKVNAMRNNGPFTLSYEEDARMSPFTVNQNATTTMVDNLYNASLSINYYAHSFNLSAQSSWQRNYRYYQSPIDGDFAPIDGVYIINNYGKDWNAVSVFTQEIRFSSPATATRVKWSGGIYAFIQDSPVKQAVYFGDDAGFLGAPETNFSIINTTSGTSSGAALFGQTTVRVTDRLSVIAGLRADYEYRKLHVKAEYQKDPDPQPLFEIVPDTASTKSFNALSPKVGLSFALGEQGSLFATFSRGFRAGGFTQLSTDPSQPAMYTYKPEYANSGEVGLKQQFINNAVRLSLAAFYTRATDVQVPTLVLPDAITVTTNAGELISKGIEAEVSATSKQLQADISVGYTDAQYTSLNLSRNGASEDMSGNRQVFTPNVTTMVALQYHVMVSQKHQVQAIARGEWFYFGEQYFDLANAIQQEGYHLLNIRAGLKRRNMELMFWMRNATDDRYISFAYDFGAVRLGDPRNSGITLRVDF